MIDVIVPVYRGLAQTRTCIESVLARGANEPFELVVVDDESPEPEISEYVSKPRERLAVPTSCDTRRTWDSSTR